MAIKIEHTIQNDVWEVKGVPLLRAGHKTKVDGKDFEYTEKLLSSKEFLENASKVSITNEHPTSGGASNKSVKKYGHAHKTWYSPEDKTVYADLVITDEEGRNLLKDKKGFSVANYIINKNDVFDHIAITDAPHFKEATVPDEAFSSILAKNSVDKSQKTDNNSNNDSNNTMDKTQETSGANVVHLEVNGKEHKVAPEIKDYVNKLNAQIKETAEKGAKALEEATKAGAEKLKKITTLHNKFIKKVPTLALNSEPVAMETEIINHAQKCYTENTFELEDEQNELVKTFFGEKISTVEEAGKFFDLSETLMKKNKSEEGDDKEDGKNQSFASLKDKGGKMAKNSSKSGKEESIIPENYKSKLFS